MRRTTRGLATAGAWLFAAGTLLMLVVFIGLGGRDWAVGATMVDGTTYSAIGLTYEGPLGVALLWVEAVLLLGAIVASLLPATRIRRIGHGALVLWAALWLFNGFRFAVLDGLWWFWMIWIVPFAVLLACTLVRAARGWRAGPAR